MGLLLQVLTEIVKILAFILQGAVNTMTALGTMLAEAIQRIGLEFKTAAWWELVIIGLMALTGAFFGIKFASGNLKTIITILVAISFVFILLIFLI